MRIDLPGGVAADYSAAEIAQAIHILTNALAAQAAGHDLLRLSFAHPQIVRYDDRHVRLSATPYALVRFAHSRGGSVDLDDAKAFVWMKDISDKRVRNVCSEATIAFADAGIPIEVTAQGSMVTVREIQNPGNPGQIRDGNL